MNVLKTIIITLLFYSFSDRYVFCVNPKKTKMVNITFIPKEFNKIELGYDERRMVKTSPGYPDDIIRTNSMAINAPLVIYYNDCNSNFKPIIPLSAVYNVSFRRSLKYIHLVAQLIHVKHIESGVEVSGEIYKKRNSDINEFPLPSLNAVENEKERQRMIEEAQSLTDEEIDVCGYTIGKFMNINIMEYVDFPFLPGKYEIWLSFSGLESNHTIVEIIKK